MGKDAEILVGLYLGTSKISAVVAEWDMFSGDEVQIIGIGQAPSRGVRKGLIVNLDRATDSVAAAIADAESMVGFDIRAVTVAFSGVDAYTKSVWGMISLSRTPRQVADDDVMRVIESALSGLSVPSDHCVVHLLPIKYSIDGNSGIDDPLGMTGIRLEVELQAVIMPRSIVQNVVNCVQHAGVQVRGLVYKPLAAALGSLNQEEKSVGAVSLSLGGGTTSVAIFNEDRPVAFTVFPIGGDYVTSDVSQMLKIPMGAAEEVKKAVSLDSGAEPAKEVTASIQGQTRKLDGDLIRQTVACRIEELLEEKVAPFIAENSKHQFPSGVVLTGGVAQTDGIETFASSILNLPVRRAPAAPIQKLRPGCDTSQYCLLMGIIFYLLEKRRNRYKYLDSTVDSIMSGFFSVDVEQAPQVSRRLGEGLFKKMLKSLKELF